ncbi:transposase [mine drainage metagenome]|uniref:Transposase n=1 Tax=mine drainage metagenome TaxID=410659 RepID=T1AXK9_9ZZZZ
MRATALYLMARQHIPFERTAEAMDDLLGVDCSTGFLDNLYSEGADGLVEFGEAVRDALRCSEVVHFDETPLKVNKKSHWIHVASNEMLTFLHADTTRGKAAVEAAGVLPSYGGVAVHDRLSMYFDYKDATHAVCGAHLLRNLASVAVVWNQTDWATAMSSLLLWMKDAAEAARGADCRRISEKKLAEYLKRYDAIVASGLDANPCPPNNRKRDSVERESYNLVCAFRDLKSEITLFASDLRVPFSNNRAESDLRMAKLVQKISGSLRADHGIKRLANVRSYISTAAKHNMNILDVLTALFEGKPWLPPVSLRI